MSADHNIDRFLQKLARL